MNVKARGKRGRPPTGKRPILSFRVPADQHKYVWEQAELRKVKPSEVAREIFELGLSRTEAPAVVDLPDALETIA